MSGFKNEVYKELVDTLISDIFYIEGTSYRTKISNLRSYTEVIIRKLLSLPSTDKVMLGEPKIVKKIKEKTNNNQAFIEALTCIRSLGNDSSHTEILTCATENHYNEAIDCLSSIQAYLFIEYFERNRFGMNLSIMSAFSILPQILRYKVLNHLFSNDCLNLAVIDKLCLIILKVHGKREAISFLERNKEDFIKMPAIEKELIGKGTIPLIVIESAPNMFDLCNEKIELVGDELLKNGLPYNNFESALELYKSKGIVEGCSKDIVEFNDLMEFIYLGRKSL